MFLKAPALFAVVDIFAMFSEGIFVNRRVYLLAVPGAFYASAFLVILYQMHVTSVKQGYYFYRR